MADHTNTTSTPAPNVAPVPSTASIDAPLLALAAEFQRVDAHMTALGAHDALPDANGDTWESAGAAVQDRWWEIVNRVIDLPPYTQAGWAAKASMIPGVFRDVGDEDAADHTLALSLVRDVTGQNDGSPDVDLLVACEAFHAAHREMKAGRGETPEHEAALGRAIDAWYAAIATVKAIPARTAAGQQAKARVVHTALHDVLPIEMEDGHREEFAALAFLDELIGNAATSYHHEPKLAPAAPTDTPAEEYDLDSLLAAAEDADSRFYDMESAFFDMRADIEIIRHVARIEAEVSVDAWVRIHDHLDLACDTLESSWEVAKERRHALRDALKAERAERKALERAQIEDAVPGSGKDIEWAETMWTMLRTMARLALERCDEALPAAA